MQGKNNQLGRFNEFKLLMLDSLSKEQRENHPLGQRILQAIVLIHTVNDFYGLRAVNENDEPVEFDNNWTHGKQGVYKLRYKATINGKPETILFRLLDQNGELNVNFCVQGSADLLSYHIKPTCNDQQIRSKHVEHLKHIFPKKVEQQQGGYQPLLRPVPLMRPPVERQPPNRPIPFNRPENMPFNNPFGKEEYIGPNSNIFGNGQKPVIGDPNPLGRYDPVDPFDYRGRVEPPDDFQGFDEFGNPILKPKIPKGSFIPGGNNPFNQPPPGFGGGGMGGGLGGFGPKFY